jgi:2-polyprenyl-3-methyl-5-hydroxy-6-metoxy-1,4-benzoquinol methylase
LALDVGCAVGGATFELSRAFTSCLGVDFSHAFIEAAQASACCRLILLLRLLEAGFVIARH